MKEIKAYLRPECLDPVVHALEAEGFDAMTVIPVQALGMLADPRELRFSPVLIERYSRSVKIEIICRDDDAERAVDLIARLARTGEAGDGLVAVSSVEHLVKIRTGQSGPEALAGRRP
ncbi:MAG: P-II family nitrogen regulator [Candidatus Krumholzibacteriia bacterium]|nr:P-II family nitrogen regulator [bacterium]MCB9516226.1 P-II family nitrogen regulator [Candidatus Latescibacterota bacterium]